MTGPPPQLPQDVWALVASHMSTKEWVKASGTCKALAAVQPHKIDLPEMSWTALPWLLNHWRTAEELFLDVQGTGWPNVLRGANLDPPPQQLRRLVVQAGQQYPSENFKLLISSLGNLEVLHLDIRTLIDLSRLLHLKHLMLEIVKWEPEPWESISGLPCLETLALFNIHARQSRAELGTLDLCASPQLRSVVSDGSLDVVVSGSCELSLVVIPPGDTGIDALPTNSHAMCTSLHLLTKGTMYNWASYDHESPFRRRSNTLAIFKESFLRLRVLRVGGDYFASHRHAPMQFSAPMPCLEELQVFGRCVDMVISGDMQPVNLSLTGTADLEVDIQNIDHFVGRLEQLCICCHNPLRHYVVGELEGALFEREKARHNIDEDGCGFRYEIEEMPRPQGFPFCCEEEDLPDVILPRHPQACLSECWAVGFPSDSRSRYYCEPGPDMSWNCSCHDYPKCSRWQKAAGPLCSTPLS